MMLRARVFISCGQTKFTSEAETATNVAAALEALGYEPYVAIQEQTLEGLTQNVYNRLKESEYFIFIDFKREKIADSKLHRGSLFSHQELAIASFLGIPVLALQERGVNTNDGILGFLQANATRFSADDRHLLPSLILGEIQKRNWNPQWRNELSLVRELSQSTQAYILGQNQQRPLARFFHIEVHNHHRERTATNCYAYLEKIFDVTSNNYVPLQTIEFKWRGYSLPNAAIAANSYRHLDAFFIVESDPTTIHFSTFSDAGDILPLLPSRSGDYRLGYLILSDNFQPARCSLDLHLDAALERTTLRPSKEAPYARSV